MPIAWRVKGPRIGFALLVLLVYLALPTKNYYWDGISFAQNIEDARWEDAVRWPQLLHPNHLIYNLIGWAPYQLLGGRFRALYVLQFMNALWAAGAVYLISGIVLATLRSMRAALLLSALFAFAGTWWRYASDANAYIPSVTLLVACIAVVTSTKPRPLLMALLHAAAMLVHQLAVFAFPALLYGLWHQYAESKPNAKRFAGIPLYAVVTGTLTIAAYCFGFAAWNGGFALRPFAAWMTSYAADAKFSFRLLPNLAISVRSWAQLFFAGRPSLIRASDPMTAILLLLCVLCLVVLILTLRRVRFGVHIQQPVLFRFSGLWLLAYALFFLIWLPNNTFYKVFGLPAIILLVASCWPPGRDPQTRGAGVAFVSLLALSNLTLAMIPYSRATSNDGVAFALGFPELDRPGSVVYFREFSVDDWFVRYFNRQSQWKHAASADVIDAELRQGSRVWLDTTSVEYFSQKDPVWFEGHSKKAEWREVIKPNRRIRFVRLNPGAE